MLKKLTVVRSSCLDPPTDNPGMFPRTGMCPCIVGQQPDTPDPHKMTDLSPRDALSLYQAGRLDEAFTLFRQVVREQPHNFDALKALGMICFRTGRYELAQHFLGEAVKLDPSFVDGLRVRGLAFMQLKRHAAALDCFESALAVRPDFVDVLSNRATALLDMQRLDEALAAFARVLALDPGNAVAWNNHGNTLVALRRFEEAVASYDRALAIAPDLPGAERNRFLALLELKKVDRIPDFAVREAFDPVASRFDKMMLADLDYRSHLHLRALAERVLPKGGPPRRTLDIGCGTGLVAQVFKDMPGIGMIDGIDVAPRMIDAARTRGLYNELTVGDFETVLAAPGPAYDLILSGDSLVYLGDLAPTFAGVAKRLVPQGMFIFTCEAREGDGWELTGANRFRHSEGYLRGQAKRAGLEWLEIVACTPRQERGVPVAGFAIALLKRGDV
jgi:predicted TPR repeat methyltransferase